MEISKVFLYTDTFVLPGMITSCNLKNSILNPNKTRFLFDCDAILCI
jgi:hypothetical protein